MAWSTRSAANPVAEPHTPWRGTALICTPVMHKEGTRGFFPVACLKAACTDVCRPVPRINTLSPGVPVHVPLLQKRTVSPCRGSMETALADSSDARSQIPDMQLRRLLAVCGRAETKDGAVNGRDSAPPRTDRRYVRRVGV